VDVAIALSVVPVIVRLVVLALASAAAA